MPSQTYDNAWVPGGGPGPSSTFVTSDQCVGCHSAGGTGLQYEMTTARARMTCWSICRPMAPGAPARWGWPAATRSSSPSSPARRRPSTPQLRPRCRTPAWAATASWASGRRRSTARARRPAPTSCARRSTRCRSRRTIPRRRSAQLGGLARDGVSCTACHHMVLGQGGYREVPRRAAEPLRGAAPGLAQSRRHRLRPHLHRQLPGRRAGCAVRAVRGSEADADAATRSASCRRRATRSPAPRCAAPATRCICR